MDDRVVGLKAGAQPSSGKQIRKGLVLLRLFVNGSDPVIMSSIKKLRQELDGTLQGGYELAIHDVMEEPQLAEEEKILATPTLVREFPPPARRIIGEFSSMDMIRKYFDLP